MRRLGQIGPHTRARLLTREVSIAILLWRVLGVGFWLMMAGWSGNAWMSAAAAAVVALAFAATDIIAYGSVLVLVTWLLAR